MKYILLSAFVLSQLCQGCQGQVDEVSLNIRPNRDQFEQVIYPMLLGLNCIGDDGSKQSCTQCHAKGEHGYLLVENAVDPSFFSIQNQINLVNAAQSNILIQATGETHPVLHPVCYESVQSCSYQKLLAWISWQEGELNFDEISCIEDQQ
jgi:hypothetical protein